MQTNPEGKGSSGRIVSRLTSRLGPGPVNAKVARPSKVSRPTSSKAGPVSVGAFVKFARDKKADALHRSLATQVSFKRVQQFSSSSSLPPVSSAGASEAESSSPLEDCYFAASSMPPAACRIAARSVCDSTRKGYKNIFNKFVRYGERLNVDVFSFSFSALLCIGFFLSLYTCKGSIGSLLMARAAIKFFWEINSELPCPTDTPFVVKFFKGLQTDKKLKNPVRKAYPINYNELEQLFFSVSQGVEYSSLSFIKQRFIAVLILAFSSFSRFEELQNLRVCDLNMVAQDFSVCFRKGKTYRESRFGVIPFIQGRDFNPSVIFTIYLEIVAKLHSEGNNSKDFLFPNVRVLKGRLFTLNTPLTYNTMLKYLKREVSLAQLDFSSFKVGLHSLRRGPVTQSVNSGSDPFLVQKLMRVKSLSMVDHYSELNMDSLLKVSKAAF